MLDFEYVVVLAGMMGAAAARHLSQRMDGLALIRPDELADRKSHKGVFRAIMTKYALPAVSMANSVWVEFAQHSIRVFYAEIEAKSGIRFFTEAGCLFIGNGRELVGDYVSRALSLGQSSRSRRGSAR